MNGKPTIIYVTKVMAMEVCLTNMNLSQRMVFVPSQLKVVFMDYNDI